MGSLSDRKISRHAVGETAFPTCSASPIEMLWQSIPIPLTGTPMTKKGPIRSSFDLRMRARKSAQVSMCEVIALCVSGRSRSRMFEIARRASLN